MKSRFFAKNYHPKGTTVLITQMCSLTLGTILLIGGLIEKSKEQDNHSDLAQTLFTYSVASFALGIVATLRILNQEDKEERHESTSEHRPR